MRKATYENQNKTVNIYMLKMKNKMTETPNESLVIICLVMTWLYLHSATN